MLLMNTTHLPHLKTISYHRTSALRKRKSMVGTILGKEKEQFMSEILACKKTIPQTVHPLIDSSQPKPEIEVWDEITPYQSPLQENALVCHSHF